MSNTKQTINYLKTNNIKHFNLLNTLIISFPTTSPQFDNLYCQQTKLINFTNPLTKKYTMILIKLPFNTKS